MNSVLPLLILPAGALLMLLVPLFLRDDEEWDFPEARMESLGERKRMLLGAVRELDFDFNLGKLSYADYQEARDRMKRDLGEVVAQLKAEEGVSGE